MSTAGTHEEEVRALPLDLRILQALTERSGHLAFNGLRRSLDVHPESLTRSLRRLERLGSIGRDEHGYFLIDRPPAELPRGPATHLVSVASVRLPPTTGPEAIMGLLAGRWFGPLRWVGSYEGRGTPSLVWSVLGVEGHLVIRVRNGLLTVHAELPEGVPLPSALAAAADELLWNALSRLRSLAPESLRGSGGSEGSNALAYRLDDGPNSSLPWAA